MAAATPRSAAVDTPGTAAAAAAEHSFFNSFGITNSAADAARQSARITEYFAHGGPSAGEAGELACREGLNAQFSVGNINLANLRSAWQGAGNRCDPAQFGQWVCSSEFEEFRRDYMTWQYVEAVRGAASNTVSRDTADYQTLFRYYDPVTDRCSANGSTRINSADNSYGQQPLGAAIRENCGFYRAQWRSVLQSLHRDSSWFRGRIMRDFRASADPTSQLQTEFSNLKQSLIASLRGLRLEQGAGGRYRVGTECAPNTRPDSASPNDGTANWCSSLVPIEGTGSTAARRAVLDQLTHAIEGASIEIPDDPSYCTGDDDNVITRRRSNGSLQIFLCPRALAGLSNNGNLDISRLRTQLSTALGHTLDSCNMEMMRADIGCKDSANQNIEACQEPGRISLARMGDGLRACLAENHLRQPALATSARAQRASPSTVNYTGIRGAEMQGQWGPGRGTEDARLRFLRGDGGSHCSRSISGSTQNGTGIQTNALEAQYWGTIALTGVLQVQNAQGQAPAPTAEPEAPTGRRQGAAQRRASRTNAAQLPNPFAINQDSMSQWNQFCDATYPWERNKLARCKAQIGTADNRTYFNLRMSYAHLCRDMTGPNARRDSASDFPPAQELFSEAARNPELRRLMGCTQSNALATVRSPESMFPNVAAGALPAAPLAGYCRALATNDNPGACSGASGSTPSDQCTPGFLARGMSDLLDVEKSPRNASAPAVAVATGTAGAGTAGANGGAAGAGAAGAGGGAAAGAGGAAGGGAAGGNAGAGGGAAAAGASGGAAGGGGGAGAGGAAQSTGNPSAGGASGGEVTGRPSEGAARAADVSPGEVIVDPRVNFNPRAQADYEEFARVFGRQPISLSPTCRGSVNQQNCGMAHHRNSQGGIMRLFEGVAAVRAGCNGGQACYCEASVDQRGSNPSGNPIGCRPGEPQEPVAGTVVPNSRAIAPLVIDGRSVEGLPGGTIEVCQSGTARQAGSCGRGLVFFPSTCAIAGRCSPNDALVIPPPRINAQGRVEYSPARRMSAEELQSRSFLPLGDGSTFFQQMTAADCERRDSSGRLIYTSLRGAIPAQLCARSRDGAPAGGRPPSGGSAVSGGGGSVSGAGGVVGGAPAGGAPSTGPSTNETQMAQALRRAQGDSLIDSESPQFRSRLQAQLPAIAAANGQPAVPAQDGVLTGSIDVCDVPGDRSTCGRGLVYVPRTCYPNCAPSSVLVMMPPEFRRQSGGSQPSLLNPPHLTRLTQAEIQSGGNFVALPRVGAAPQFQMSQASCNAMQLAMARDPSRVPASVRAYCASGLQMAAPAGGAPPAGGSPPSALASGPQPIAGAQPVRVEAQGSPLLVRVSPQEQRWNGLYRPRVDNQGHIQCRQLIDFTSAQLPANAIPRDKTEFQLNLDASNGNGSCRYDCVRNSNAHTTWYCSINYSDGAVASAPAGGAAPAAPAPAPSTAAARGPAADPNAPLIVGRDNTTWPPNLRPVVPADGVLTTCEAIEVPPSALAVTPGQRRRSIQVSSVDGHWGCDYRCDPPGIESATGSQNWFCGADPRPKDLRAPSR